MDLAKLLIDSKSELMPVEEKVTCRSNLMNLQNWSYIAISDEFMWMF